MRRIATATLLLALTAAAAAACGGDETVVAVDEKGTTVVEGTHVSGTRAGTVTVPRGEKLLVDFGSQNNSIGDDWFLVGPADPAVLADEGDRYDSECDESGCGADMWWQFGAVGPGTTEVTFQYCYRSRPPDCEAMPDRGPVEPVTLTVTVTAA
jgi:predicted secreted protein